MNVNTGHFGSVAHAAQNINNVSNIYQETQLSLGKADDTVYVRKSASNFQ